MSSHSSRTATTDGIREAVGDAHLEAAVAMLTAVAVLVANGLVSRSQGWRLRGTPWWTWIVLAVPEVLLLILLVVSALGDVRPGKHRDLVMPSSGSRRWPASPPLGSSCGRLRRLTSPRGSSC